LLKVIPKYLEKHLMDYLTARNVEFHLKSISVYLPNRLCIIGPEIRKDQAELKSKEITFYFDFSKFLKKRDLIDSFYEIFFIEPEINFKNEIEIYNLKTSTGALPEINIRWKNGKLFLAKPNIKLNSRYGKISFTKELNSIVADFSLHESSERFKLEYILNKKTKNWNAKVTVKENKYLPDYNCQLQLSGNLNDTESKMSFNLENKTNTNLLSGSGNFSITYPENEILIIADINELKLKLNEQNFSGNSKITFSKKAVTLENLTLSDLKNEQKISAKGSFVESMFDFKIKTEKFQINNLSKKIKGELNSDFYIQGHPKEPEISGNISLQKFIFSSKIPEIQISAGRFFYKNGDIKINGDLTISQDKYSFYVSGKNIKDEKNDYFYCQAKATGKYIIKSDLNIYREKLEVKNCKIESKSGENLLIFSFSTGLKKDYYNDFTLNFEFDNLRSLKRQTSGTGYIIGKLNLSEGLSAETLPEKTKIEIDGYELKDIQMKLNYKKNILEVSKFESDKNISGSCTLDFDKNTIAGNINLKKLELKKIINKDFSGTINSNVTLSGDINKPEIKFTHFTEQCAYKNFQFSSSGEGKFKGKEISINGKIKLTKSEIGDYEIKIYDLNEPKIYSEIFFEEINLLTINSLTKDFLNEVLPISGIVSCRTKIEGFFNRPNITFEINSKSKILYSGKILPETWTNFELLASLERQKNQVKINKMTIESDSEMISVSSGSTINFLTGQTGEFNTTFKLQKFSLWPASIFGEITTTGAWEKSKEELKIKSKLCAKDLWINQQKVKNLSFNIAFLSTGNKRLIELSSDKNQTYQIGGKIDFSRPETVIFENISIQQRKRESTYGTFNFNGKYTKPQIDLQIEGNNIQLDTLTGLMDLQLNLEGLTDFVILVKGSKDSPYITGTTNISNGSFFYIPFTNAILQFNYKNRILNLTNAKIIHRIKDKEKLVISGHGKVPIFGVKDRPEENIDIIFQLENGDLSILESASEDIKFAEGKLDSKLKITGTVSKPQLVGYFTITNGNIESKKYFNKLRRLNVGITFADNKLEIKEFSGRIGDGKFEIGGYLVFGEMFGIEECNLTFETPEKKGIKIFIPELPIPIGQLFKTTLLQDLIKNYSFGEPHANLKLVGKKDNLTFKGYIQLDNTHFSYPPQKTSRSKLFLGILSKTNWDIEIRAGENTWYESELMSANITGALKITGPYSDLTTNGKIESTKGSINYINKIYEIKHFIFEVVNDECFLQGKAETSAVFSTTKEPLTTRTQQENIITTKKIGTVEMNIPRAPLGQIVPQFSSKDYPDLESEKLFQATYGITESMDVRERDILFRKQIVQLIDSTLASPLARNLLQKSGLVDSLRVTYSPTIETESDKTNTTGAPSVLDMFSGTKYIVEKYLTKDFLLGYALTLGEMQRKLDLRHEIELQYRWKSNIFVTGIYGYEPRKTFDREDWQIRVEPHWRFGWPDEKKK